MAYDEGLAHRLHEVLGGYAEVEERKMFGGLGLLLHGNMCCGVIGDRLIVRVGPAAYAAALSEAHAREFDFTGRPMKGLVYVEPAGYEDDDDLEAWVQRAVAFVQTLPAK